MPVRIDEAEPGFAEALAGFLARRRDVENDVRAAVAAIIARVREEGVAAVLDLTERFDRVRLTPETLRLTEAEIERAVATVEPRVMDAIELAAHRIESFHRSQDLPRQFWRDEAGVELGARFTPIDAVGIYVPGGLAAYPSSVLMNAVPARVAGVGRVAMAVPTPDGVLNGAVLAAARFAGVTEIWRMGGAQAVAALAFGTREIAPVDKIVGPGNAFVAEAKRQVFGAVGIDMIAGPSEILVVADRDNDPDWIAADLLSQAEHDESAQSVLVTDDRDFADRVAIAVEGTLASLARSRIASASWRDHGAIIVLRDMAQAPAIVDRIAPEHLELAVADPHAMAEKVHHAGAIFLGRFTPEAIGDYVAGPNHVLPTSRSARFSSGLNVLDFVKRTTLVGCDATSLARIGPYAITLAEAEGLDAHALSLAIRLKAAVG